MHAVVSHETALEFLDKHERLVPPEHALIPLAPYSDVGAQWARSERALREYPLERFSRKGMLLDILVPSYSHTHASECYSFHASGAMLPEGSLLDAGDGVLICSAPLVFVLLCKRLPLMRCIKLGHYICGAYSPEPSAKSGVVKRRPLATKDELKDYVEKACKIRGSRNAKAALPWVLDGAASPQETNLALPFYLPLQLGGFGFAKPELNGKERLTKEAQAIEGSINAFVDVYWREQKVGFEYSSYSEHGDPRKIGEDERRKLALKLSGVEVELVTANQLADFRQLEILAQMLKDHGVPIERKAR